MERLVVLGILMVLQCHFIVGENDEKVKRLLLNDPDVVGQISRMQNNMDLLTRELNTVKSELAAQKLRNTGSGSVYIRWGRSVCTGSDTILVYSGYASGQHYNAYSNRFGGPASFLCLPHDPELTNMTAQHSGSFIYGTEYEESTLRSDALNEDVPCALCKSTNTHSSVMIPGRKSCYPGWKVEYNGFLASDHIGHSASSYICIDNNPEYVPGGQKDENGRRLYLTLIKCGALSCPPYKDNHMVHCVVCSQ